MGAFLYGVSLQWKLDIRSKTLLITCYIVPLLFFVIMGGIFTSVMPEARYTLIQSMTVFGVTMGALIGLPPSLVEIYSSDIKKVYKANGVPLILGLALTNISAYIHLFLMSIILYRACFVTSNSLEDKQYGLKYGRIGARELGKSKEKACTYRGRSGCIRTTVSFGWKISSFHMGNWTQKTIG